LLRYAGGNWYIQDPGSTSGFKVNGEQVGAARLKSGDKIQILDYIFVFRAD
jgi:pSer/pThr/pTyr-binding forkhead associated (FHA) protein